MASTPRATADAASIGEIGEIYRLHYPRFLRFAAANLNDVERGRDAVHEAFVRAIRSLSTFRGEGSLESWIWQILVNVLIAEGRHRLAPLDETLDVGPEYEATEWPEVRAEIARLPERQRVTLFLRHYADLDYEQIAAVLGVTRGTVAATLHVAHGRLRDVLGEVKR